MFVYANLLGSWEELTEDDTIDGLYPQDFIEKSLLANDCYENYKVTNGFCKIVRNNIAYHVHKSCIQYTYKI